MITVAATIASAAIAGLAVAVIALRFPAVSAPRVSPRTLLVEADRHPSLFHVMRSRVDATRIGSFALGAVLLALAAGGALIGVVLWMVRSNTGLAHFDLGAARWGATHATAGSTSALRSISLLGGTVGSIVIAVLVAVAAGRRLSPRAVVGFLATVMIGQWLLVAIVKEVVARARPDIDRLTGFAGSSFPSGHAATAAATFAAAALLLGYTHSRRHRAVLAGLAGGLAVAVATTRVLLGVHWLTDVVAGLLLGWTWFAIVSVAFGGRLLRFAEPIEAAERVMTSNPD